VIIERFIRNKEDTVMCLGIVNDFIESINVVLKILLINSGTNYPKIPWEVVIDYINKVQQSEDYDLFYKYPED
jgi:hypothetical protein